MKKPVLLLVIALLLAACSADPETVEVTRLVEVPIEVTRQVETKVEVTRLVESTRLVEVEITRVVEVPIEVTRIVMMEEIVTATPEPTPTSASENVEQSGSSNISLLQTMQNVRDDLLSFGGMMDGNGSMSAARVVELYDRIAGAQEYNVSNMNPTQQNAYNNYRSAIAKFTLGARDLAIHARDFLASGEDGSSIPFQQWGPARQSINDALDLLNPAIESLGG